LPTRGFGGPRGFRLSKVSVLLQCLDHGVVASGVNFLLSVEHFLVLAYFGQILYDVLNFVVLDVHFDLLPHRDHASSLIIAIDCFVEVLGALVFAVVQWTQREASRILNSLTAAFLGSSWA
jgi:hypothetical protein